MSVKNKLKDPSYRNHIKLLNKPPWDGRFAIACSGGADSMAALWFTLKGGRRPEVVCFNHNTEASAEGLSVVKVVCEKFDLVLHTPALERPKDPKESREEFWRNERYGYINSLDMPVLTGHNLDDVVETWLFGAINGTPKLIPYNTNNVFRPFMLNTKASLKDWMATRNLDWYEDKSNNDVSFARCRIRHNIVPEVLKVNPGIHKTIKKKVLRKFSAQDKNSETPKSNYHKPRF